jgi:hypothetical protein
MWSGEKPYSDVLKQGNQKEILRLMLLTTQEGKRPGAC